MHTQMWKSAGREGIEPEGQREREEVGKGCPLAQSEMLTWCWRCCCCKLKVAGRAATDARTQRQTDGETDGKEWRQRERDRDKSSQCCIQKGATTRAENKVFARVAFVSQVANTHLHTEATGVSNFKLSKVARTVCVCVCVVCVVPDTPSQCLREWHAVVSAVDSCIDTRQFNIDANFEAPTSRHKVSD